MNFNRLRALALCLAAVGVAPAAPAERAVVTNNQRLYREARVESKAVGRITVGEEALVTGREGALIEVTLPDRVGWTLANGLVVVESNPRASGLLYDAAHTVAQEDSPEAWRSAARLFRKAASLTPDGPYTPEALWRAAELTWRADLREIGPAAGSNVEKDLAALGRRYPKTSVAARAAFLLLRNTLCDDWDGTPGCPESEIGLISDYVGRHPGSPNGAEARYAIAYRHAALVEIYLQQGQPHFSAEKAVEHKTKAGEAVAALAHQEGGTDWAARGERLLWSLENNLGVFSGIEIALRRN